MPVIVPTITAFTPDQYKDQLNNISFAKRIHPDFTDNDLAPSKTVNLAQAYWPNDTQADIHLMFRKPADHLEMLISMNPSLVILHAEADGDLAALFKQLKAVGIKSGVAILPDTKISDVAELVAQADHALIFGGRLGYQGSELQVDQLPKLKQVKALKTDIETGWDGGVHEGNVAHVATAGADVINVGGFIQKADNPKEAFEQLQKLVA